MSYIKKCFGQKLKFYREQNGYTQESLAEALEMNFRSISLIERGVNFVTAETLEKFCTILRVSPKELFDFNIDKNNRPNLSIKITDLSQKDKKKIEEVYKILKNIIE